MELKNWLVWIIAALVFVFGVLKRLNGWYYEAKLGKLWPKLPPGDMGWPLLGSTLSYLKHFTSGHPRNVIHNLSIRYGKSDMYKAHLLGRASIIVCTSELCRQVLCDEDKFKPSLPRSITLLSGRKSLMQVFKAEHRRLRRLTTGLISGHMVLEMYINYIQHTVINGLEEWASMKKPIELLTEIKKLTFKIIWNIFMGSSSIDSSIGEIEPLFTKTALGFISLPINFPGFIFHKSLKGRKQLLTILQSIINQKRLVKEREGKKWEAKDMMDLLMELKDEEGEELDDETIKDLIFGKLFAGHETSAYTAMWAILFLTNHPHIFQKAKEEQEDIIKRRPTTQKGITLSEVKQMKFLYQVIDETLRVSGITFMVFREAVVDVEINGKIIPKGWKVIPWFGELYMDEKQFPSPREFNPSRWDNFVATPGAFTPFGLGNRYCPGSDLAKLEISIFLHYFLLSYKVEQLNPKCQRTCLPFPHLKDKCLARVHKVE
ncbi:beta-amyrin 11-oxidase-like [Benincasa hispida]|uniref:beta-amyrin 11-oxidase-like n=1 Tax=Benincasa hispida TaxID=102211 RepID=UPI0018FF427B|nr:beta-amyrin 11-oxidase-like [Benincasa hispida]XP_038905891.1 beta-amyrin 11-oxidase-like [Benincasa hispida]